MRQAAGGVGAPCRRVLQAVPPTGIIAGKNDGKVAVEDTHLPEPLHHEHIVVDCSHPGLRSPANVLEHILKFFRTSTF